MAEAFEIILAELAIKDLSTKDLKKIDKALSRTKKNIKSTEKSTGKLSKTFGRLKSPGLQRAGRGVRRVGRGVRRGVGGLTGGFGGIPIIGGAIAAALAAMSATKARFVSGVSLKRELDELANDFRAAFGKQAKKVLSIVKKEGNFFREDDFRAGFTALSDAGIDPESIQKNISNITQFAKAQGFTTVTEAVQALTAGRIKAGRGLGVTREEEAQRIIQLQALAPFLQNVASAEVAFQEINKILESAAPSLKKFAKATDINTKKIIGQSNVIRDETEKTAKAGIKFEGIFKQTEANTRIINNATAQLASATAGTVSGLIRLVPKIVEGAKTAFEGIKKGAGFLQKFFPGAIDLEKLKKSLEPVKKTGKIQLIPKPRPVPQQRGASINIDINVTAPTEQIGSSVAKEIRKTLNLLARTTFRHNTGLILSG